jgi:GT2 family glycosyltransferase
MGATLLITTLDRPDELRRCLASVLRQDRLPEELVLVDATPGSPTAPLAGEIAAAGIRLRAIASPPGRTRQLNAGIAACTGDPVIVVDDDVVLESGFVRAIVEAFEREGPGLGAAQGLMLNHVLRPWPLRALRAVFLQARHTRSAPGRVLPSGYYTLPVRPTRPVPAEAVPLTATAYRRHVLEEFPLDEALSGYALKEDIDLSYRVSRRYRVIVEPAARFRHLKTPTARIGAREKSAMHVVNNFWFHAKHLRGSAGARLAFAWAMTGRLLAEVGRSIVARDASFVLGTLDGLREVYRSRGRVRAGTAAR